MCNHFNTSKNMIRISITFNTRKYKKLLLVLAINSNAVMNIKFKLSVENNESI